MKTFVVVMLVLLFCTVATARIPDFVIESFSWPDSVRGDMLRIAGQPFQVISLTRNEQMEQVCDVNSRQVLENATLYWRVEEDTVKIHLWRIDYDEIKYLVIASEDENFWYWTTRSNSRSARPERLNVANSFSAKLQYNYWNANYGDRIAGSRVSGYVVDEVNLGMFSFGIGAGLTMRYKPSQTDRAMNEMMPMYRGLASVNWHFEPQSLLWLSFDWHTSGSYFKPIENQHVDEMEIYSKFSYRIPFARLFLVNGVYYGSQPSDHNWLYSEGKLQILFTYKKLWLGIEPYVATKWQNDSWQTESMSDPGNLVFGGWTNDYWFEISYGRYHKKSGDPVISQENDEEHLSLTIGATF
jgi:hypothetical protein